MITYEDVEKEMRRLIAENPDFKYEDFRRKQLGVDNHVNISCRYLDEDQEPSCIFGQVFSNLGLSAEELDKYEGDSVQTIFEDLKIDCTYEQMIFLGDVQSWQDKNMSWSSALELAEEGLNVSEDNNA